MLVQAFVIASKRERYLSLLANPRKRSSILDLLNHNADLDWSKGEEHMNLPLDRLEALLLERGASAENCYLIGDQSELDGGEICLRVGLEACDESYWGCILDCSPGELAVYWSEVSDRNGCWIFQNQVR